MGEVILAAWFLAVAAAFGGVKWFAFAAAVMFGPRLLVALGGIDYHTLSETTKRNLAAMIAVAGLSMLWFGWKAVAVVFLIAFSPIVLAAVTAFRMGQKERQARLLAKRNTDWEHKHRG